MPPRTKLDSDSADPAAKGKGRAKRPAKASAPATRAAAKRNTRATSEVTAAAETANEAAAVETPKPRTARTKRAATPAKVAAKPAAAKKAATKAPAAKAPAAKATAKPAAAKKAAAKAPAAKAPAAKAPAAKATARPAAAKKATRRRAASAAPAVEPAVAPVAAAVEVDPDERAVRRYLEYLTDPSSAIDAGRVAALNEQLAAASDIVVRLRLSSELGRAASGDSTQLIRDFVVAAKRYAEANDISVTGFADMGVPAEVLVAAGLASAVPSQSAAPSGPRRRVTTAAIMDRATRMSGPFTIQDVRAACGASGTAVKKALEMMVEQGSLLSVGPDPQYSARGRAPARYQRP